MKTWTIAKSSLGAALVALPLIGGCVQESASSEPTIVVAENDSAPGPGEQAEAATNAPTPEAAVREFESAPAKVVSSPLPPAQTANLNAASAEIAKLAQSGVDENVMLAFATNSTHTFNLSSDQIIYLNDIGVPGNVVTAMIQHDQGLSVASAPPPQTAAPIYSNPPSAQETQPTVAAEAPLTPPVEEEPASANVTYSYFYDSLAPYGSWIEVDGYGRCWRPTACAVDRGWTPYSSRGRWVYSDCGWYWSSDYSWGWAPFHYGRWFRHGVWGWCWAPDTVWGPAWVSWRYSPGYCGWAPLPPTACYRPGFGFTYYGRSVGANFSFGLGVGFFTFVGSDHFCDPHPFRHRVPYDSVTRIYDRTTIINPVVDRHDNPRFHRGIPPRDIAAATHRDINPVRVHDTPDIPRGDRGEHLDRDRGTLTVFRPHLPDPPVHRTETRVGEGIKRATPATTIPNFTSENRGQNIPRSSESEGFARGRNTDVRQGPDAAASQHNDTRRNIPPVTPHQPGVASRNETQSRGILDSQSRNDGNSRVGRTPALNNHEPRDPRISRGHPETMTQPNGEPSQSHQPVVTRPPANSAPTANQPQRNELLLNRRQQQQFNAPPAVNNPSSTPSVPRNENQPGQFQQREQRVFRQEAPRFQQPDQRVIAQPSAPVQRQPDARVFQRPSQPSYAPPAVERSAPVIRSQPAPAPQMQAPQGAPAVRQNDSGGGGSRQSGNDGQRNGGQHGGGRQR